MAPSAPGRSCERGEGAAVSAATDEAARFARAARCQATRAAGRRIRDEWAWAVTDAAVRCSWYAVQALRWARHALRVRP